MTIMLFGAVGTLISFSIISLGAITLLGKINIGLTDIGDYLGKLNSISIDQHCKI